MWLDYGIACEGERTVVLVHGYPESYPNYDREEWPFVCRLLEAGNSDPTSSVFESPLSATTKASDGRITTPSPPRIARLIIARTQYP